MLKSENVAAHFASELAQSNFDISEILRLNLKLEAFAEKVGCEKVEWFCKLLQACSRHEQSGSKL